MKYVVLAILALTIMSGCESTPDGSKTRVEHSVIIL